ncbi:MAG: hypothetical protein AAF725_23880, partial [Acidobacteriota bacterium]
MNVKSEYDATLLIGPPAPAAAILDRREDEVKSAGGVVLRDFWRPGLERPAGAMLGIVRQALDLVAPRQPELAQRFGRALATALPELSDSGPLEGQIELLARVPEFPLEGNRAALIEFYQRRSRYFLTQSHFVDFTLGAVRALAEAGQKPVMIRLEGAENADRLAIEIVHLLHQYGHRQNLPMILAVQAQEMPERWHALAGGADSPRLVPVPEDSDPDSRRPEAAEALLACAVLTRPFGAEELSLLSGDGGDPALRAEEAQSLLQAGVDAGWLARHGESSFYFRSSKTLTAWYEALGSSGDGRLSRLHALGLEVEAQDPFASTWHTVQSGQLEESGTRGRAALKQAWALSAYETAIALARSALDSPAMAEVDADLLLGLLHFESEDYREADRLLSQSWQSQEPGSLQHADLQWLLGYNAIFGLEDFDRGRGLLESILEYFQREGKQRESFYLRNSMAYSL